MRFFFEVFVYIVKDILKRNALHFLFHSSLYLLQSTVEDRVNANPDKIVGRFERKAQFFIWVNSFTDSRKILLLLVMIPTTLIALYELRTVMKLGRQMNEDHEQEEKERHEKAVRDAIEAEKRRLEEIGYTEDEDDAIKSGIVDEKEND